MKTEIGLSGEVRNIEAAPTNPDRSSMFLRYISDEKMI